MRRLLAILLMGICLSGCAGPAPTQLAQVVQSTQVIRVCGTSVALHASSINECWDATATPSPTTTATPTATGTATPTPTATASPTLTPTQALVVVPWHPPGTHLDPITHLPYPVHEHGDAPPAWTAGQTCVPFSQSREGHVFYKGMTATSKLGVESYIIVHVATTAAARAHGDHDYMIFFKTPVTNVVSCLQGLLDFGSPPPLITATVDPGTRPIILSKNDGRDSLPTHFPDCETWYDRPGALVFDLGWTICNRWTRLDGSPDGGNGAHRGADWHVYVDRFGEWPGMDPGLAAYAIDDGFGHKRLDFVRNDVSFPSDGVIGPN